MPSGNSYSELLEVYSSKKTKKWLISLLELEEEGWMKEEETVLLLQLEAFFSEGKFECVFLYFIPYDHTISSCF